MGQAALAGVAASSTLMVGAVIAYLLHPSARVIAIVMALGSGLLIGSVAYDLVAEANLTLSLPAAAASLLPCKRDIAATGARPSNVAPICTATVSTFLIRNLVGGPVYRQHPV